MMLTLIETAGTFYMLQACMRGNCLLNLGNSVMIPRVQLIGSLLRDLRYFALNGWLLN